MYWALLSFLWATPKTVCRVLFLGPPVSLLQSAQEWSMLADGGLPWQQLNWVAVWVAVISCTGCEQRKDHFANRGTCVGHVGTCVCACTAVIRAFGFRRGMLG